MKFTIAELKQNIREEIQVIKEGSYNLEDHWAQWATDHNISQPWENEFLDDNWTREQVDFINETLKQAYIHIHDKLYEENDEEEDDELQEGGLDMSAAAKTDGRIDQGQDDARDIASRALSDIERASEESGLEVDDLIQMVMAHIEGQK